MTAKKTKEERDTEEESHLDKIFTRAEKLVRGFKIPGFGSDFVVFNIIGTMPFKGQGFMMNGPDLMGEPHDSGAMPLAARPEPEWSLCPSYRRAFRTHEIHGVEEEEKGVVLTCLSYGPSRLLIKESWDEVCAAMGITPVLFGEAVQVDENGNPI